MQEASLHHYPSCVFIAEVGVFCEEKNKLGKTQVIGSKQNGLRGLGLL